MSLRLNLLTLLVAVLLAAVGPEVAFGAAPTESDQVAAPLRFRRVFAPADRLDEWPWGDAKYIPMEPAEFERLVKAAGESASESPILPAARVLTAEYRARLEDDTLTLGRAAFQIVTTAAEPELLSLEPCNLAVAAARYAGDPPGVATVGLGADDRFHVVVPGKSGEVENAGHRSLELDWSLLGTTEADGTVRFRFELPACPTNRLILDLPQPLRPVVDQGWVDLVGWSDEAVRRWQIELGGHHRPEVRILPDTASQPARRLPLVRESVTYHLQPNGVDVVDELEFDSVDGPVRQLTLTLDSGLRMASAEWGGVLVPWTQGPSDDNAETQIVVRLPQSGAETQRMLVLRALAPLVSDRPWRLPRIRTENVLWQEGTATLLVPTPLVVQRLVPLGCRQTSTGPLPGSRDGETSQFQFLTADATLELVVARYRPPVQLTSGTTIELTERGGSARMVADFRVTEVPRFVIESDVSPGWVIDSVESLPADAMEDWAPGRARGRRRTLTVRLAKSLAPASPLRLVINARRFRSPLSGPLAVLDLVPLQFQTPDSRRLVAVRAAGPYRLRSIGTEQLRRIDLADLGTAERDLLDPSPGDLIFENDSSAAELMISLENRPAGYSARVAVEAVVDSDSVREEYTLQCVPESLQPIDRVLVHLSGQRDTPVRWSLGTQSDQPISARRFSAEELAAAGLAAEREAWELVFRRPVSGQFEIRGVRETRLFDGQAISLASMPEAASQSGSLVIRSTSAGGVHIHNRRLVSVPAEVARPGEYATVRATFRYDPAGDIAHSSDAAVTISRVSEPATPAAWVWKCRIESRYEASGAGRHLVAYRVQNAGGREIQIGLPSGVTTQDVQGVWVDEDRVPLDRITTETDTRLAVDLPPGEQFPVVTVLFQTATAPLRTIGSFLAPVPTVDLKVLEQEWAVAVPPGYGFYDASADGDASGLSRMNWSRRLFGPLGRGGDRVPFDPLAVMVRFFGGPSSPQAVSPATALDVVGTNGADCWSEAHLDVFEPVDARGWKTHRLPLASASPVRLRYVHRPTILLLASVGFLLVIALAQWTAGRYPQVLGVLAVVFGLAALALPDGLAPVASGLFLGILFCLAYRLIRVRGVRARAAGRSFESDASPHSAAATVIRSMGIVAALVCGIPGVGAAADMATSRPATAVQPVFIPVDETGQPTGGKYYVPQEIYNRLRRGAPGTPGSPQGSLIKSAVYRGTLAREVSSQRFAVAELKVDFVLEVFDRAARVRIPLGRAGANLLPGTAVLDGRPIQPEWDADGAGLLVDVPGPGEYHLELSLRPALRIEGTLAGFDLIVPVLASSRMELNVPSGGPAVTVPSAVGMVELDDDRSRLVAQLGPTGHLSVRWPEGTGRAAAGAVPEVEELLWLKVQPGSVVVDVRLAFSGTQGQLRQIRLECDPRLRLLPLEGDDLPMVEVRGVPGQPQTILLQWRRPVSEREIPPMRFVLTETSGVGNVRLPQLKVLDVRSVRRWLAVSVDPALEHQAQALDTFEPVPETDFVAAWGAAPPPLFACRLPSGESTWNLSTRLREPQTTVEQNLIVSFDWGMAAVQFEAEVEPRAGYIFQHRLQVPPGLLVEDVSVVEGGISRVARWSQDETGTITVFLTELMAGPQVISLYGWLPIRGWQMVLPVVDIEGAVVQSSTVDLYRRPSVLAEFAAAVGLEWVDDPAVATDDSQYGRLLGRFRADGEVPAMAVVNLTANYPRADGAQVTWFRRGEGSWTAQTDWSIQVTGGVADEIRIEAPTRLDGPFQVTPAVALRQVEVSRGPKQIVLRPPVAVSGECRFSLSSPLASASSERSAGAAVAFGSDSVFRLALGTAAAMPASASGDRYGVRRMAAFVAYPLRQYLVLPTELDGQPVDWETRDLEPADMPPGFEAPPDAPPGAVFRIVGPDFQAIPSRDEARQAARVRLADIDLAWLSDGGLVGAATFDLEPGKLSECRLQMPPDYRLLRVSVAGVPTEPILDDSVGSQPAAWRVPLGPATLPQRIEVLFSGQQSSPASAGNQTFAVPVLEGLPVEQTLWTVVAPASFDMVPTDVDGASGPGSHALARLRSAAALIEAASVVPTEDPEDTRRWYTRWVGRLAAARSVLTRAAGSGELAESVRREIGEIEDRQTQIAQRLGVADVYLDAIARAETEPTTGSGVWQTSSDRGQTVVRCELPRSSDAIALSVRPAEGTGLPVRLIGLVGLAGAAAFVVVGLRRGTLTEWFSQWPQAIGVAVGLAWWLWLWPSFFGWIIVLVSVAASLSAGWRNALPDSDSTVVSLRTQLP